MKGRKRETENERREGERIRREGRRKRMRRERMAESQRERKEERERRRRRRERKVDEIEWIDKNKTKYRKQNMIIVLNDQKLKSKKGYIILHKMTCQYL